MAMAFAIHPDMHRHDKGGIEKLCSSRVDVCSSNSEVFRLTSSIARAVIETFNPSDRNSCMAALARPSNTNSPSKLAVLAKIIKAASKKAMTTATTKGKDFAAVQPMQATNANNTEHRNTHFTQAVIGAMVTAITAILTELAAVDRTCKPHAIHASEEKENVAFAVKPLEVAWTRPFDVNRPEGARTRPGQENSASNVKGLEDDCKHLGQANAAFDVKLVEAACRCPRPCKD